MVDLARELAGVLPGLRTSSDEADRVAYARDLWPRHHLAVRAGYEQSETHGWYLGN